MGFNFISLKEYKEADIIHLHWINHGFVDIKDLNRIKKPIVWTARDMWPFTGGCHYSMDCTKYIDGCGHCEQLRSSMNYDLSKYIINRKKKYIPKTLKVIGISNWITDQARKSFLFKDFDVRTIGNNVNTNDFFGIKKDVARSILGIHTNKKIILTSSPGLREFHKGFDLYLDALSRLDKNKYFLCFFGKLNNSFPDNLGFEYRRFGFLHDNVSLRLLYSAADVFVAPSIMDAFGKTIAEAMSCCTPAVCFDATGPKDIVDHKVNGYLAKPFESSDMAEGIKWILDSDDSLNMGSRAREKIKNNFDSEIVAKKYIELYKEILGS